MDFPPWSCFCTFPSSFQPGFLSSWRQWRVGVSSGEPGIDVVCGGVKAGMSDPWASVVQYVRAGIAQWQNSSLIIRAGGV